MIAAIGHTLDMAGLVPPGVWVAIFAALVAHTLYFGRPRQRTVRDDGGWRVLRPTRSLYLLGWLVLIIDGAAVDLLVVCIGVLAHVKTAAVGAVGLRSAIALAAILPLIAALLSYLAAYIFLCRFRYCEKGIERDFAGVRAYYEWPQFALIDRHWLLGPRFRLNSGKAWLIWEMFGGFADLVRYAGSRGVPVALRR